MSHFQSWAEHADIPWRAIKPHLEDVLDKARSLWPQQLAGLPMANAQKEKRCSPVAAQLPPPVATSKSPT